ncbi:putative transferase protein [Ranid herpesvirus 3]|uniref:Putative transferase protein n=1 Tax=Ranid herpesvirus 3 TaxID=1987509 RepID=A0A1X9T5J7_9VIRU|nr:putative transferase protein [Ranid herpesvirus 3]ARR28979.1 putative transferase protein [Ranid herpesvirus 3]
MEYLETGEENIKDGNLSLLYPGISPALDQLITADPDYYDSRECYKTQLFINPSTCDSLGLDFRRGHWDPLSKGWPHWATQLLEFDDEVIIIINSLRTDYNRLITSPTLRIRYVWKRIKQLGQLIRRWVAFQLATPIRRV